MAEQHSPLLPSNTETSEHGTVSTSLPYCQKLKIYFGTIISFVITTALLAGFFITGIYGIVIDESLETCYIQIGATVIGIALSISETILAGIAIKAFIKLEKEEEKLEIAVIGQIDLRNLTWSSGTMLFTGLLLINTSISCVFWAYTVAGVIYPSLPFKSYYIFILMRTLVGVVVPIFLCIGITLILLAAQKVTDYNFQAESVIPGILSFVSFKIGQEYCFWVIANFFYFVVDKNDTIDPKQKLTWMQKHLKLSLSSCCITLLLIFNSILPMMLLTNELFVQQKKIDKCSSISSEYDCFLNLHGTHEYIDCSNHSTLVGEFDCFMFVSIKQSANYDPLNSLIKAVFLFVGIEKFILIVFSIIKTMFNFRRSKIWIFIVVLIGLIMITGGIISIVIYHTIHSAKYAFLSALQFTIFSFAVLFAGILLLWGSPMVLVSKGGEREITLKPLFAKKSDDSELIKDKISNQL